MVTRLLIAAVVAATLLFTAACGGGDDESDATSTSSLPATEVTSEEETPQSQETSVEVDQTFWHSGWKLTLGTATFTSDSNGDIVAIDTLFENLGSTEDRFNSQLVLVAGGENYTEAELTQDFPNVPGELTGEGVLAFNVDEAFDFDDATLIIGNPDNQQATVPIGPNGDDLVDLAPIQIEATGTATAGAVTLTVTGIEVRADFPDKHDIAEKGTLFMTVAFDAAVASGIPVGEGVLQSANVLLKLPNGTAVAVRDDGVSGVNELLQGKEGTTIPDLLVRFEIPEPIDGDYAFVVRGVYGPTRDQVEGEFPFTIAIEAVTPAAGTGTPAASTGTPAAATGTATP